MADQGWITRALTGDRSVRVIHVEIAGPVRELVASHELDAGAARLAAEGAVATALLSSHIKGVERITLQARVTWPVEVTFIGEADADGGFRGKVAPNALELPDDGVYTGTLLAIKHNERTELYRGHTAIAQQTFEQALASHLGDSTQVEAFLRILVQQDDAGRIVSAAGMLVERLPDHSEHPTMPIEDFQATFAPLQHADAEQVFLSLALGELGGSKVDVLDRTTLAWVVRVSLEKVEGMLRSLGPETLEEMAREDGQAEVKDEFSGKRFVIPGERLLELAQEAYQRRALAQGSPEA